MAPDKKNNNKNLTLCVDASHVQNIHAAHGAQEANLETFQDPLPEGWGGGSTP